MRKSPSSAQFLRRGAVGAGSLQSTKTILIDSETVGATPELAPASGPVLFGMIGIGLQDSRLLSNVINLPCVQ